MSLSSKDVQRILNAKFICVWINIKDEGSAGASFAHRPGDPAPRLLRGNGEHNNQVLLLTPQDELLSALAGYIGPDALAEELHFGLKTLSSLSKTPEAGQKDLLAEAHRKFARELDKRKPRGSLADVETSMQQALAKLRESMPQANGLALELPIGDKRGVQDHRFMMEHPLMSVDSFRTEMLVGNAETFFGSSVNGTPGETITGRRRPR